ncbi:MAG: sulfotransferase domain-containing protein [Candidatus Binataceae bacterium]
MPSFLAVGPPRTGTTWLDRVLRGHVGLPAGIKETQFFVWRYHLGIEWYAAHFRDCPPSLPVGEVAPTYFGSVQARQRIALHIPRCKIICTLRDPVERLYSNYKMWRKIGVIKAPFETVALTHKELLSHNQYASHIKAWREMFGVENTFTVIHEDSRADRQDYINRISEFIGIPRIDLRTVTNESERLLNVTHAPKSRRLARSAMRVRDELERFRLHRLARVCAPVFEFCMGRGEEFKPIDPEFAARLREHLRPEVEQLEELLQRDLSIWKQTDASHPVSRRAGQ